MIDDKIPRRINPKGIGLIYIYIYIDALYLSIYIYMSHSQYSFVRKYVSSGHVKQKGCKATRTLKSDTTEFSGESPLKRWEH